MKNGYESGYPGHNVNLSVTPASLFLNEFLFRKLNISVKLEK